MKLEKKENPFCEFQTSGWGNHCGLASLSHWLLEQLNEPKNKKFINSDSFKSFCIAFQKAYGLKVLPNSQSIQKLLSQYAHPFDKQAILSLGFRQLLQDSLLNSLDYKQTMYEQFIVVARAVYTNDKDLNELIQSNYSNLFSGNVGIFSRLKIESNESGDCDEKFKALEETVLKQYWKDVGFKRYCEFVGGNLPISDESTLKIGDLKYPMITADELSMLCSELKVSLNVYGPKQGDDEKISIDYSSPYQTAKGFTKKESVGALHVSSLGNHWQRVMPLTQNNASILKEKLDCHNHDIKLMSPALASPIFNRANVVASTLLSFEQKGHQSPQSNLKTKQLLLKNIALNKPHLVAKHLQHLAYIDNEVLSALDLDKAIKNHDSELLVALMASSRVCLNLIVKALSDSKNHEYLARLTEYVNHFNEHKLVDKRVKITDSIAYYDTHAAHQDLETVSSLKTDWTFGLIYSIHSNKLNLKQDGKAKLTVLHSAILRKDKELYRYALEALHNRVRYSSDRLNVVVK